MKVKIGSFVTILLLVTVIIGLSQLSDSIVYVTVSELQSFPNVTVTVFVPSTKVIFESVITLFTNVKMSVFTYVNCLMLTFDIIFKSCIHC